MPLQSQAQYITQDSNAFPEWLDFEYLRQRGLEHLGLLSGNLWTDHNTHDPGITMLEVLCFALMDLGYRNQFDTSAIFARKPADLLASPKIDDNFWTPAEILSGNPLTLKDYARLLLDIPGVRNAWLEKASNQEVKLYRNKNLKNLDYGSEGKFENPVNLHISGLYNVYLDLEPFLADSDSFGKSLSPEMVMATARERLHAHRNLCEDFLNISIIPKENVWFCMEIDLRPEVDPEDVFLNIFDMVQQMLTPSPHFHTLQEMLEKGYDIDQLFEGRPLVKGTNEQVYSHGFLESNVLETLSAKKELNLSDVYQLIISQLPRKGVRGIRRLTFFSDSMPNGASWNLTLDQLKSPRLLLEKCEILYSKGQLPIRYDSSAAKRKLNQRLANYNKVLRDPYELGDFIPQGKHYDFAEYTSIQREFPAVYGINENELPIISDKLPEKDRQAKEIRKRQSLQLKAYLAFFDQLLANYLSQLANVRQLFALRPKELPRNTYFNTLVENMPDAGLILRGEDYDQQQTESYSLFHGRVFARFFPFIKTGKLRYEDYLGEFNTKPLLKNTENLFRQAFEQNLIQLEIYDRWNEEGGENLPENKLFYFLFKLVGQGAVLISELFYKTRNDAENAANLLRYLAFLEESYSYEETLEGYIGHLVYKPIAYADYLSRITESPEIFNQRRDKFLNHLLARFGEQFTEYTLLSFALEGAQKAMPEILADKARFLSRYDETARNRGKGFDYTKPKVWDTENVSGFEQRVAGFMGLDNWSRRTLSHLKLVGEQTSSYYQWKIKDLPIFESHSPQVKDETLAEAFRTGTIYRHDCEEQGLYSFTLKTADNCTQISYLPFITNAEEREETINYWQKFFEGQIVTAQKTDQRFRFVLKNLADEIVLKSSDWFINTSSAMLGFYKAVQHALNDNFGEIIDGRSQGQEYDFSFYLKDENGVKIAEATRFFETPELKNQFKSSFIADLKNSWPEFSVNYSDGFIEWAVRDQQGETLFQSSRRHKIDDQAGAFERVWQALLLSRQVNGWRILPCSEQLGYYLSLGKIDAKARLFLPADKPENWLEIARSPKHFASEGEASVALKLLQQALEIPTYLERAIQPEKKAGYRFLWFSKESSDPLFRSNVFFNTRTEAAIAFEAFLKAAQKIENYLPMPNGRVRIPFIFKREIPVGDPKQEVPVFDEETFEALSLIPFPEGNREEYCKKIRAEIEADIAQMSTFLFTEGRYFTSITLNGEEDKTYHLRGKNDYQDEIQAYQALYIQLQEMKKGGLSVLEGPSDNYRLLLSSEERIIAEADEEFEKLPVWILPPYLKSHPETIADAYGYLIPFWDCAGSLNYFYSTSDQVFETAELAITAGTGVLQQFNDAQNQDQILKIESSKIVLIEPLNGKEIAETSPFPNPEQAKSAKESIKGSLPKQLIFKINDNKVACAPEVAPGKKKVTGSPQKDEKVIHCCEPEIIRGEPDAFFGPNNPNLSCAPDLEADSLMSLLPSFQPDYPNPKSENDIAPHFTRFRLRDENYVIARFYTTFLDAASRNAAHLAFWQYWQCADKKFPDLLAPEMVQEVTPRIMPSKDKCSPKQVLQPYYFQLSLACGASCFTLRSNEVFSDEEEIKAALSDQLRVSYVALLADCNAFVVQKVGNGPKRYEIQVFDYRKVALTPKFHLLKRYNTQLEANKAIKEINNCAKRYPFFIDNSGKIGVRLYNVSSEEYEWIGVNAYSTIIEARNAFMEMLRLLEVPANICRRTRPFALDLGEVMLDSVSYESLTEGENPGCFKSVRHEIKVWEIGVENDLLNQVFKPDGVVVAPVDNACQYTYKVVNDGYHLAFHPYQYRNANIRAEKKKELMRLYACGNTPQISKLISKQFNDSIEERIIKKKDEEYKVTVTIPGYCTFTFEGQTFNWRSPLTHDGKSKCQIWFEQMTPWVEYPEFYHITPIDKEKDQYQLELHNEDGITVAIAYENDSSLFSFEEASSKQKESILFSHEYPVKWVRPTRKETAPYFVLRIYSRYWQVSNQAIDEVTGAYIWESFKHFKTEDEALKYKDKCFGLLFETEQIKSGFALLDTQGEDCNDFSFELVDNKRTIAQYPGRFPSRHSAEDGAKRMLKLLDSEGFHVVENILLRPFLKPEKDENELLKLPPELTALWDISEDQDLEAFRPCIEKYLPGGDPYSAQVTVVLPFWAKRFRNSRFRDFFENTLRRELPAHCKLAVNWVNPREMFEFEYRYKQWLIQLANGNFEEGKSKLIRAIEKIKSTYTKVLDDADAFIDEITLL
ncbi:hypothetical protein [Haliscomenobacter sp.]|uniref:hypothetical protein n=1 Tax=Haliscomenobacter sp. TaxID=2717303 RepID=UPI003BACF361